jgi:hypothetical protein
MRNLLGILFVAVALALSPAAAAAQGKGQGGGKGGHQKPAETRGGKAEKDKTAADAKQKAEEAERERQAAEGRAFGKDHEKKIRGWFANPQNLQGLPPGLAKREELPPGLQRQLQRNGTLPPGLQKRIQPLPANLEKQLPKPPDGVKRVVVAGNVILLEERTSKILDIMNDVVGGKQSGATSGVQRTK